MLTSHPRNRPCLIFSPYCATYLPRNRPSYPASNPGQHRSSRLLRLPRRLLSPRCLTSSRRRPPRASRLFRPRTDPLHHRRRGATALRSCQARQSTPTADLRCRHCLRVYRVRASMDRSSSPTGCQDTTPHLLFHPRRLRPRHMRRRILPSRRRHTNGRRLLSSHTSNLAMPRAVIRLATLLQILASRLQSHQLHSITTREPLILGHHWTGSSISNSNSHHHSSRLSSNPQHNHNTDHHHRLISWMNR